ncbi:MAG: C4-type zinc ribbon domain-containing protein, partial [Bacteroidales bacterium]|nr:C4-type zinc ribbon domain-containing protein [Bacteroidales bacterium]
AHPQTSECSSGCIPAEHDSRNRHPVFQLQVALSFHRHLPMIPHQRQMDIRMHKKIIVCEYCGRILVDQSIAAEVEDELRNENV